MRQHLRRPPHPHHHDERLGLQSHPGLRPFFWMRRPIRLVHPGFGGFSWMRWAICTVHPGFATFSWMSIRGAGVVGCFAMVEAHGSAAPAAPRGGLPTCAFPHFAVRHVKRQNAKKCKFLDGPSATQKPYRIYSGRSSHARSEWGGIHLSATLLPGGTPKPQIVKRMKRAFRVFRSSIWGSHWQKVFARHTKRLFCVFRIE